MNTKITIQFSPAVAGRIRREAAWNDQSQVEFVETLVLEALKAREAKEAASGRLN